MEATGVYWKPVFYLLEHDMECWLLNARHMKSVPGRKTDVKDSEWIAKLVEHGLVRPSFVPPEPIRQLRDVTRYRTEIVRERTRETQRLEKLLEDTGIKLSATVSNILGVSGRAMLEALIAGHPLPHRDRPRTHPGDPAAGEAAGGHRHQTVRHRLQHPRRLRPRDARGADRR
ncbi:transposase [Streptomyces sp. HNM0645]|uniref:IS110 family transposase n=1 Tax=Streptomyces sp. HNM0645 TaxID=2782343 RepID=UPI0024B7C840|nr:transposase [Streptomyces sp. HNM0645]MDI9888190.1 transposase [Streptomyces sp. HNM0645]